MKYEVVFYEQSRGMGGDDEPCICTVEADSLEEAQLKSADIIFRGEDVIHDCNWDDLCYRVRGINIRPYVEAVHIELEDIPGAKEKYEALRAAEQKRWTKNSHDADRREFERLKKKLADSLAEPRDP